MDTRVRYITNLYFMMTTILITIFSVFLLGCKDTPPIEPSPSLKSTEVVLTDDTNEDTVVSINEVRTVADNPPLDNEKKAESKRQVAKVGNNEDEESNIENVAEYVEPQSVESEKEDTVLKNKESKSKSTIANISTNEKVESVAQLEEGEVVKPENDIPSLNETKVTNQSINHELFNELLIKHVSPEGRVNYEGLKDDEHLLDQYTATLAEQTPSSSPSDEGLAYWINAYNAFTIKLILKNYPTQSIMDLHNGKAWDVSWIELDGKTYSLNDIEHKIIRPTYNDGRIHFAVNCAAKSCPPLLNQAYTGPSVHALLDQQSRKFINDSSQNVISESSIELSKIFEWYKEDFGNLIDFVKQYTEVGIKQDAVVSYIEYDWSLNN